MFCLISTCLQNVDSISQKTVLNGLSKEVSHFGMFLGNKGAQHIKLQVGKQKGIYKNLLQLLIVSTL